MLIILGWLQAIVWFIIDSIIYMLNMFQGADSQSAEHLQLGFKKNIYIVA